MKNLKCYVLTLIDENGPYFYVYAKDFEISYNTITKKPYTLMFGIGNEIISSIEVFRVYRLEQIIDEKCIEIDFKGAKV